MGRQPIGPDEARVLSYAQQFTPGVPPTLINTGDRWLQPLGVYATTIAHTVMPGFFAGRWASVLIASVNATLIFLVAWRLLASQAAAAAAALVLILVPAHMTYGRQGVDAIYIVPFVLLWLCALLGFLRRDLPSGIAVASMSLGAGVYATPAAPLTMAFLFVTMMVVLWIAGRRKMSTMVIAAGGFAIMLLPLAIWFAVNPHTYMDTYGSWAIHPAHIRNPLDGLTAFFNSNTLGTRASAYWSMLDPSYLFLAGVDARAPLHWAAAPLIALGIYRCALRPSPESSAVLAGALVAPLAGASFGLPHYMAHAMALTPFLALLSGYGVAFIRELAPPRSAQSAEEHGTFETDPPR